MKSDAISIITIKRAWSSCHRRVIPKVIANRCGAVDGNWWNYYWKEAFCPDCDTRCCCCARYWKIGYLHVGDCTLIATHASSRSSSMHFEPNYAFSTNLTASDARSIVSVECPIPYCSKNCWHRQAIPRSNCNWDWPCDSCPSWDFPHVSPPSP